MDYPVQHARMSISSSELKLTVPCVEEPPGIGRKVKKKWVRNLYATHNLNFLSIQETKQVKFSSITVRAFWGNSYFGFSMAPAIGRSGGILCIWDKGSFSKHKEIIKSNFIAIEGNWISTSTPIMLISVYASQYFNEKKLLWNRLSSLMTGWNGKTIIMGDFNEVRWEHKRYGSIFHRNQAHALNEFISQTNLIDISLGGFMCTWSDKEALKMSKIDRFLTSEGLLSIFPHFSGLVLMRHLSDPQCILLHEVVKDYGATPFRLFHSWFLELDFVEVVENSWGNDGVSDTNDIVRLKYKLKALKNRLKVWRKSKRDDRVQQKRECTIKLEEIDKVLIKDMGHNLT
uniref:RNA-directed DNA polymerase, eukaryota n=1 Tax=Tanacetum cinerariifolium TaxID=118510 RepID=A0A6L2M6X3_TANCI|nr:RNA-directed DNA polymerase, eukaryota [Tanacetum cinerariifolium]